MFTRAAEMGDKDALYVMGVMHEEGVHVVKSKHLAANYYQRAAELNQTEAKVNLAVLLMKKHEDEFSESINDSQNTIVMSKAFNKKTTGTIKKANPSYVERPSMNYLRYID